MDVAVFTFNDFQENTYVLYDATGECVIVDPGCYNAAEEITLSNYIGVGGLTPKMLVNTHCHIDHIFGNKFVSDKYGLALHAHKEEQIVLEYGVKTADLYGLNYKISPPIQKFLVPGEKIKFGNQELEILFTPGHSPASVSLYNSEQKILISGDVLFQGSIGRTDLPGGDFDTIINVVKTQFFTLPDDVIVYSGHGPSTTIGQEKRMNPFFKN